MVQAAGEANRPTYCIRERDRLQCFMTHGERGVVCPIEAPPCLRYIEMPAPDFAGLGHGTHQSSSDEALVIRIYMRLPMAEQRTTARVGPPVFEYQ